MSGRALAVALILACFPVAASAAGKLLSTTGVLKSGDVALMAGDALPDAEIRLATGTATLAIDGARFLLKGPARLTPRKKEFKLDLGGLLSAVAHRAERRFSVRTPTVVAAVRGTDFFVEVGAQQQVDICICHGALKVTGKGMEPVAMKSADHSGLRFWPVKSGTAHAKGDVMSEHNDAEIETLRALLAAEKP